MKTAEQSELARPSGPGPSRAHLWAGGWSVVITLFLALGAHHWASRTIDARADDVRHDMRPARVRGLALNLAALRRTSSIPVFGSSELSVDVRFRADRFFGDRAPEHPMHVMAGGGVVLLNHVVEVGALASTLRDRSSILFLAPVEIIMAQERRSWFFAGNFSRLQTATVLANDMLSDTLRRDIASLLARYPSALAMDPVVAGAARLTRGDASRSERLLAEALRPALALDAAWLRESDFIRSASELPHSADRRPSIDSLVRSASDTVAWDALTAVAHAQWEKNSRSNAYGFPDGMWQKMMAREAKGQRLQYGAQFAAQITSPIAWQELSVLLRTLSAAHSQPLVVCLPMAGRYMEATGATPATRAAFYARLQAMTSAAGVTLIDFRTKDLVPGLLDGIENHLSPEGWLLVDRAIASYVFAQKS